MALSRNVTQIQWPTDQASVSVAYNSTSATAQAISFDSTDVAGVIQVSVDNANSTPVSGDTMEFYIAYTTGDVLGDGGDDYDTIEHAQFIGVVDTYPTNTPGEDPVRKTMPISVIPKGFKLICINKSVTAASSMTVRALLMTQRAA